MLREGDDGDLTLGTYPTPVFRLEAGSGAAELWVKDDGATNARYGGNKVRKIERILPDVLGRGARRIVTTGGAGSHHVLATTLFARERGLRVAAALLAQPRTDHVAETLRVAVALGLEARPVATRALVAPVLATLARSGDRFVTAGGSNVTGTLGYVHAAHELEQQVDEGLLPEPDEIVVALGSGGTAAGLLAGVLQTGLRARVTAVKVVDSVLVGRPLVLALARAAARRTGHPFDLRLAARRLRLDASRVGGGYGVPTIDGERACRRASELGLTLDATYTAKAFAAALEAVRAERPADHPTPPGTAKLQGSASVTPTFRPRCVLYWHTLSRASPLRLMERVPEENDLPASLKKLLLPLPTLGERRRARGSDDG